MNGDKMLAGCRNYVCPFHQLHFSVVLEGKEGEDGKKKKKEKNQEEEEECVYHFRFFSHRGRGGGSPTNDRFKRTKERRTDLQHALKRSVVKRVWCWQQTWRKVVAHVTCARLVVFLLTPTIGAGDFPVFALLFPLSTSPPTSPG